MSSIYSIGQMNELADALESDGFTTDELKALTSNGRLRVVKAFLEGKAEIVMKKVEEKVTETLVSILTRWYAESRFFFRNYEFSPKDSNPEGFFFSK